jgi:hypothetical protein
MVDQHACDGMPGRLRPFAAAPNLASMRLPPAERAQALISSMADEASPEPEPNGSRQDHLPHIKKHL